jgi:hypothetical protein
MFVTPNMGLIAWDQGTDNYDHSQLANNMQAIDQHRHIPGEGRPIPSAGIEDNAITTNKIANDAVTPNKIPDGSISQQELAKPSVGTPELFDNSVTNAKVAPGAIDKTKVDTTISFIGEVRMWYRTSAAISPPVGWEIMDGRPWNTVTNAMGPGGTSLATGNMPNMINRYPLGAAASGATGTTPATPPDIGVAVGAHQISIAHTHVMDPHTHAVDPHIHSVPDHAHYFVTNAGGSHAHTFAGGHIMHSRMNAIMQDVHVYDRVANMDRQNILQSLYVVNYNQFNFDVGAPMDAAGNHQHDGTTVGFGGGSTGAAGATSSSVTTTMSSAPGALVDNRPGSLGLLFIMRVI